MPHLSILYARQDDFEGLSQEEDWTVRAHYILKLMSISQRLLSIASFLGMWSDSESTVQVPGGAFDSLSSNTKLGKAVQEACDELDTLVTLVRPS